MNPQRSLFRALLRRPSSAFAMAWLALVALMALVPKLFTRRDPLEQDLAQTLKGPMKGHPLGTDVLGQDLFARIVHGTRPSMVGMLIAVVVALVMGVTLGLLAGYLGGVVDAVVSRFAEIVFSIPGIIVLLVVYTVFPYNVVAAMGTFGVIVSSGIMRLVRGVTLSTKQELFVAAAQVSGLSSRQIIFRHLLPRVRSVVIVQAALLSAIAIVVQSGLAVLGFGPRPPAPTWGSLVADARASLLRQTWMLVPTGLVIAITVFALTALGEAIREHTMQAWAPSKLTHRPRRKAGTARDTAPLTAAMTHATAGLATDLSAGAAPTPLLDLHGLSVGFPAVDGMQNVVTDVSLQIMPGETVGLVGESGCGKSVSAMAMLGLVAGRGEITGGVCWFDGKDMLTLDDATLGTIRGRRIGFISQEPMVALDPTWRVGRQIAEAVRRHHGLGRREAAARAIELLTAVNLPDPAGVARRYPHQMSGGMAQRAVIALALAGDPTLLIADEPTTALDVTVQAEILALLRRLSRERNMAVLLVTHNWGVVADICDRALVMYAGEVVESATVLELFRDARHPYTLGLLRSNPRLAVDGERLPAIGGTVPAPGHWPSGCRFRDRCTSAVDRCAESAVPLAPDSTGRLVRCLRADELLASMAGATA